MSGVWERLNSSIPAGPLHLRDLSASVLCMGLLGSRPDPSSFPCFPDHCNSPQGSPEVLAHPLPGRQLHPPTVIAQPYQPMRGWGGDLEQTGPCPPSQQGEVCLGAQPGLLPLGSGPGAQAWLPPRRSREGWVRYLEALVATQPDHLHPCHPCPGHSCDFEGQGRAI